MPLLTHAEYDNAYFDPRNTDTSGSTANSVLAGYSGGYGKWFRGDGNNPSDAGELYAEIGRRLNQNNRFGNKSVLEVGCAYGFIIEYLRSRTPPIEAYGIDVSSYAHSQAHPSLAQPYITVGDALPILQTYSRNQLDWLISRHFFECLDDAVIQPTIDAMDFCSRNMIHIIGTNVNADYYNKKTPAEWQAYDWGVQTTLFFNDIPNP